MVPNSSLRVYQPLETFGPGERSRWTAYIEGGAQLPLSNPYRHVAFDDPGNMGLLYPSNDEHAFVKKANGQWLVCPWSTKLRVLMGLLSFRNSWPYEIADAFVPEEEAAKAATELESLKGGNPDLVSHITTASWHVPLRWFIAFEDGDKRFTGDASPGTGTRLASQRKLIYETDLRTAVGRVQRGVRILRKVGMAEAVVEPIDDLMSWLRRFPRESIVELDYGSVGSLFEEEDLQNDRSAGEVWSCLEALDAGDFDESGRIYSELSVQWGRVRALQTAN